MSKTHIFPAKFLLAALLAAPSLTLAAQFFTVVPLPAKKAEEVPIKVALSTGTLPEANLWSPYAYDFNPHLSVTGDNAYQPGAAVFSASQVLPPGLTLNADGTLTGTPTDSAQNVHVHVVASYKGREGTQLYQLRINGSLITVTLDEASLPPAKVGKAYSHDLAQYLRIGNDANPTTASWSAHSALPAGITLSPAGALAGTPTAVTTGEGASIDVLASYKDKTGQQVYKLRISDRTTFDATSIVTKSSVTCAITPEGAAKCWGNNASGQLGDGTTTNRNVPTQVVGLTSGVTDISIGSTHVCAIQFGQAKCWGANGQLQAVPYAAGNFHTPQDPLAGTSSTTGVTAIAAGSNHTCVVQGGAAKCWGYNNDGQLGNGSVSSVGNPVTQVQSLTSGVTQITAGGSFTCAIHSGITKCWGANSVGQLGDTTALRKFSPTPVAGVSNILAKISAGQSHACAVSHAGTAYCWGNGSSYQTGLGTNTSVHTPTAVSGLSSGVTDISAGTAHSCAVQSGGVFCWGADGQGALGNGSTTGQMRPVAASNMGSGSTAVSAGALVSCAIHNGLAKCSGYNASGQLGNKTTTASTVFVNVVEE